MYVWETETEEDRMKMNEIGAAWLRENDACNDGRKWALSECATLAEVWRDARRDRPRLRHGKRGQDAQAAVAPC